MLSGTIRQKSEGLEGAWAPLNNARVWYILLKKRAACTRAVNQGTGGCRRMPLVCSFSQGRTCKSCACKRFRPVEETNPSPRFRSARTFCFCRCSARWTDREILYIWGGGACIKIRKPVPAGKTRTSFGIFASKATFVLWYFKNFCYLPDFTWHRRRSPGAQQALKRCF